MPSLQAVATNGKVIATLGDVSQHAETLGFNPDPAQRDWISADWPHFFRTTLEHRFGGVGIEMAGSVGSNETPQVYTAPISRVPQQFVDASHPAGCRTLFEPERRAGAGRLRPGDDGARPSSSATRSRDALDRDGRWSATNEIWGVRRSVCIDAHERDLHPRGAARGVLGAPRLRRQLHRGASARGERRDLGEPSCCRRSRRSASATASSSPSPARSSRSRSSAASSAARTCRTPGDPMPPLLMPHMHEPYRFVDGLAEDMLGYMFPQGNGVGVIGEPHANDGTDRFGCGHSDDSEATSSQTAQRRRERARHRARRCRRRAGDASRRAVTCLPTASLSRDPQGPPGSIKCNVDTVFQPSGPAVAVWLPGGGPDGHVVRPAAWMVALGTAAEAARSQHARLVLDGRHAPLARRLHQREGRAGARGPASFDVARG